MWTTAFWKDTFERILATVLQVVLALITVDGFNLVNFDFAAAATAVGVAAVAALAKAVLAAVAVNDTVSPASLAKQGHE